MMRKQIIRFGFALFLFSIGFLVGGGLSKTIRHLTQQAQTDKPATTWEAQNETS